MFQPPVFILPPEPVTVLEGESFTLSSIAKGKPTPQMAWFKDGKLLDETDNTTYSTEIDENTMQSCSKLLVNRADVDEHEGRMAVEATNEAGEAIQEVEVTGEVTLNQLTLTFA